MKIAVPYIYTIKNLRSRRLTTALTVIGMAMVIYVFATALMLSEGLERTFVTTGSPDNVIVLRRASQTEIQSIVDREQAAIVENLPQIATGGDGGPLVSKELVVLVGLYKQGAVKPSNVTVRGVSAATLRLRDQIKLTSGRMFRAGSSEIIVGSQIARGFTAADVGGRLRFGMREWTVVGVFDGGVGGFSSEVWGDVNQMMQAFRRNAYSSLTFKLAEASALQTVQSRIDNDQRLTLTAKRETVFYTEQSENMANALRFLGLTLSVIFSAGAVIGAMITMHASVANRTTEIGTLRALGFRRLSILISFLAESLAMGLLGGIAGVLLASAMQFLTISTMNWQTFSELAFTFTLTPGVVVKSFEFALLMGFIGGFLPAVRAARLNIVDALRSA